MLDLIKSRKSVRKYSEKHISDEDLRKILEAGRLAPSWMNVQSWKFILIKSEENKELLSKLSLGQAHVKNADALIVCVADVNAWKEAKITHIKNPGLNPALQGENGLLIRTMEQVIYPISYMMLEAESLGIKSCIIGAMGNEITGIEQDTNRNWVWEMGRYSPQLSLSATKLKKAQRPKYAKILMMLFHSKNSDLNFNPNQGRHSLT